MIRKLHSFFVAAVLCSNRDPDHQDLLNGCFGEHRCGCVVGEDCSIGDVKTSPDMV